MHSSMFATLAHLRLYKFGNTLLIYPNKSAEIADREAVMQDRY